MRKRTKVIIASLVLMVAAVVASPASKPSECDVAFEAMNRAADSKGFTDGGAAHRAYRALHCESVAAR